MKFKKLLAIGLTMAMFLSAGSQALADASSQEASAEKQVSVSKSTVEPKSYNANATSGSCGDSMTWSYNESTGVLSISGSGEMTSHPWDGYKKNISVIKFSGNIASICIAAFSDCTNIESVTIPDSVVNIGYSAFRGCKNLDTVKFGTNSSLTTLGINNYNSGVFENCINLDKIVLPDQLTGISNYTFSGCTNLETVTIGKNVKSIGYHAFYDCINIDNIVIPDSVKTISEESFYNCNNLSSIKFGSHLESIGKHAFQKCSALTDIVIPSSVKTIGCGAFQKLNNLKSVTFETNSNLTSLGENNFDCGVFQDCTGLKAIVLPDSLTGICYYTFSGCKNLETVLVGKSVEFVGYHAFYDCVNLKNIVLPDSVKTIYNESFYNCNKLSLVKFGGSLESIGDFAFKKCSALTEIFIPASVTVIGYGAFQDNNLLNCVTFEVDSNLTTLGKNNYDCGVFQNCTSLKKIVLPDKLTSINNYTFFGCSNLESVIVGKHVVSINYYAFKDCTSLKSIILPKALTSIANEAFINCSSLNTVKYTGSESRWNTLKSDGINTKGNSYLLNVPNYIFNYVPAISSISIKTKPKKLSYTVGEKLNTTGLVLNVSYEDGSGQTVDEGFTCTPTVLNTAGTQKILVTYDGKTTSFDVTVNKPSLNSISVKSKPSKLAYTVGETLATSGLKLTATYSDNSTKEITSGFTCTPTKLSTAGTQKITVTYEGKTTSFNVTVNEIKKTVKTVSIASKPSKLTYKVGETLNTDGLKLLITYSDGSTATVTSGFTCTPTKLSTAGIQKITVTYEGKTTSFNVTVNEIKKTVKSISIASKPSKLTYKVGETLNTDGLKLLITYSDGSTATVTSGFTCTPTKLSTAGTQKITVKYNDKSTSFNVTVNKANKTVKSIKIKSKPTKLKYKTGEKLNTKGLKLTVTYTDKSTSTITSGFTCSPTNLSKAGTQKITVNYNGKTTSFNVTVSKVKKTVKSIKIGSKPTKLKYKVGEKLNTSGLKLTVTYTDNSTATVTSGFTCSPTKLSKAGTKKITVKYKGKKTSFNVTVSKVVKSIKIKSKPSKLKYKTGETLNTNGLKLTVTYTDKSTKTISSGFTCSPTAFTKVGTQKITVKYGGKSASFNVTVSKGKTTSNTLPKLTKDNVAKELEKQIRWYAAYQNSFNCHTFKKTGGDVAFTDSNYVEYYRVYDYNSIKEVQNELSKYVIVPTNDLKQWSCLEEKSGKLYAKEFYGNTSGYDLKSVTLKEFKDNAYYVYVNVYEMPEYYGKDLLKIVEKDGQYKIESVVEGKTAYDVPLDMDSHPEKYHLVAGLGD